MGLRGLLDLRMGCESDSLASICVIETCGNLPLAPPGGASGHVSADFALDRDSLRLAMLLCPPHGTPALGTLPGWPNSRWTPPRPIAVPMGGCRPPVAGPPEARCRVPHQPHVLPGALARVRPRGSRWPLWLGEQREYVLLRPPRPHHATQLGSQCQSSASEVGASNGATRARCWWRSKPLRSQLCLNHTLGHREPANRRTLHTRARRPRESPSSPPCVRVPPPDSHACAGSLGPRARGKGARLLGVREAITGDPHLPYPQTASSRASHAARRTRRS
eukprot:scaffold122571_cov33-Tisochrysis_lutea.AAC.2